MSELDANGQSETCRDILAKEHNVHSQFGEDGIIEEILSRISPIDRWCVEFGAWDGIHLSNTRRLIEQCNYSAILIEGSAARYEKLVELNKSLQNVTCLNAFVGFDDTTSLDTLLRKTQCPKDFDFLSIDIDGNDIHAWKALRRYRPKLVCIEFNPTIPVAANFAQPAEAQCMWGSSLRALYDVGVDKRYRLVCANRLNAFFVAEEHWRGMYARNAEELDRYWPHKPEPVYVFPGYDGSLLTSKPVLLNWHGYEVRHAELQPLPRYLRKYPDNYTALQRILFRSLNKIRHRFR